MSTTEGGPIVLTAQDGISFALARILLSLVKREQERVVICLVGVRVFPALSSEATEEPIAAVPYDSYCASLVVASSMKGLGTEAMLSCPV